MPSGTEMLTAIRTVTQHLPPGSEHWIDITEKLDLCKLKVSDLFALVQDEKSAEHIVAALNHQDVGPLGQAMGIRLLVRFRMSATRQNGTCEIRCDGRNNCEWMREYVASRFPHSQVSGVLQVERSLPFRISIQFDQNATPYAVREAILQCPAVLLVQLYDVRVSERPHCRIEAHNLAAWLEDQGEEPWWTVDGDPILMSRLEFPAPPDELATVLRKIGKPVLVADPSGGASGEELVPKEIPRVVQSDELGNRLLLLAWEDGTTDWQLIEDEPTSEGSTSS